MRALALALVLLGLALPGRSADQPATPPTVFVDGPAERVFDAATQGCAAWDIPDTPARAWRDAEGRVHLLSGSERSRASLGPALGAVSHDCAILFQGAHDDDPGAYDDRAWVHATYALDGGASVIALAHVEYHGHARPGLCPSGTYADCWRNAVVELGSTDGGRSFLRGPGTSLVAALPYRFDDRAGRRTGYFNPSNILRRGDFLYAFVFAEAWKAQRRGACLIRRSVAGGPGDWRAWDGIGFGTRFADPYREDIPDPAAHVCAPVTTPAGPVASTLSGVVSREGPGGTVYLAVTAATMTDRDGATRTGVWALTSEDLVRWSPATLLHEAPLLWRRDCGAGAAYAYPALLDDDSSSRNFSTADDRLWLYLVEMPLTPASATETCRTGPDRRLVRLPVRWPESP